MSFPDKKLFKKFIEEHPYPSYKQVMKIIEEDKQDYLNMFAEYGDDNHQWMKEIYRNPLDKETVKKNGKKIYDRGGKPAMVWNYYTLLAIVDNFLVETDTTDSNKTFIMYNFRDLVSVYWDSVGEWQH